MPDISDVVDYDTARKLVQIYGESAQGIYEYAVSHGLRLHIGLGNTSGGIYASSDDGPIGYIVTGIPHAIITEYLDHIQRRPVTYM